MKSILLFLLLIGCAWAGVVPRCQAQVTVTASGPLALAPNGSVTLSGPGGYGAYRWTRNNVDVVGTQPSLPVTAPGYYRVEVNNGGTPAVSSAVRVTVYAGAGSPDQNYTQEDVVLQAGVLTEADVDAAQTKKNRSLTYLDGLMRPTQQVAVKASPGRKDVVQLYEYLATGQQPRQYLPYTGGADGLFKPDALASQQAFYSNSGPAKVAQAGGLAYAEAVYEDTPSGGTIEQGAPGASWQVAKDGNGQSTRQGHTKRTITRANTGAEVALWAYVPGVPGVIGTATYSIAPAQTISVTQLTDEDGKLSWQYTNMLGQVVAVEVLERPGVYLTTAYAYDHAGRRVMVMPPEGVKRVVNSGEPLNSAFLARWAYLTAYDERGRTTAKKVPGKDWDCTVYDRWDRTVATQDGNQRRAGKWAFVKYDELNRAVVTGQIASARTWQQLTADVEAAVAAGTVGRYESPADNTTGPVRIGYTLNKTWPADATGNDLYTVSYFDDYRLLNGAQARLQYQQEATSDLTSPSSPSRLIVGLPTILQTRILGSNTWLTSVTYYDDLARILQFKSENQLGGVERRTNEYDYAGKTVSLYTAHNVTTSGPAHTIRYRYTYHENDALKEIFVWFDKSVGTAELLLSKKEYNELGQLVDDKLGTSGLTPSKSLQSVDYRYNIRGWLTHLNNRDLADGVPTNDDADAEPDLFGFELKYDADLLTGAATARYNGNIAESMWRSRRDNKLRSFGYRYDNANRLTDAYYAAYAPGVGWTDEKDDVGSNGSASGVGRFTTSGIEYDLNGNITRLNRVGRKAVVGGQAQFGPIDQLRYDYSGNGNQLRGVVDQAGRSDAPNDFEDVTPTGDDYAYDPNGNMTSDANKGLAITYNELDLPSQVRSGSAASTTFTYSATGEKLGQARAGGTDNSQLTYVGGFMYTTAPGPALSVATPTGRALYGTTPDNATRRWIQEYHIRDHLGNLRIAFRDEGKEAPVQRSAATMEAVNAAQEAQTFDNLDATRQFDPDHARTGSYAARLNAGQAQRMYGPSASVQVHAGDSIRFEAYGRYDVGKKVGVWPAVLPVAVAAGANAPGTAVDGQAAPRRGFLPKLAAGITLVWTAIPHLFQRPEAVPRASIKYDFYDKDSVLVASEVRYLEHDAANAWQQLAVGFKAQQDGYVLVSAQNGSPKDVWLDDFTLRTTTAAMIVQENHYDPWGQNLVDIELAGTPDCKQQFGDHERLDAGLEWVDHGARQLDTQLGRWHVPDPADQFASPYTAMGNNPVLNGDPDGRWIHILVGAVIGGVINVATHWDKIGNFGDGLVAFGIGAAAGALTAATGGAAATGMGLGLASFGGGAVAGAVGAALGSPVQGIGNAAYFNDAYSAKQWGTDVLIGGATGGIAGWIGGVRNNARYAAKGLPPNSLLTGKELPSTDALGNVVPDGFTAQFPEYSNLTPGGRYTYTNPATVTAKADIGNKLSYMFGKATGAVHNIERSTGMLRQLNSVGIFDNAAGNSYLRGHLQEVFNSGKGILQSNGRYLRESLLMGPNGGLKMESIWDGSKLITMKLLGGK